MGIEGWLSRAEAEYLYSQARNVVEGCVVEVGSYRGRSTTALALGVQDSGRPTRVYALDPHEEFAGVKGGSFGPEDRKHFMSNMVRTGCYKTVRLINLGSITVTQGWSAPVSLLFVDGDHRYSGVKSDVDSWLPHLRPEGVVILDDVQDPDLGPAQLVSELIRSGSWTVIAEVGKMKALRRSPIETV